MHHHESIIIKELGKKEGNKYVMYPGKDTHVAFKIDVEEKIVSITIQIHDEKNNVEIFGKEYKEAKYVEKKEVHFHEHINITESTKKGHAHFRIKVLGTDKKVLAEKEEEIHMK